MKTLFYLSFVLLSLLTAKGQDSHTAPLTAIVQQISNSWEDIDANNKTGINLESIEASFTLSKTTSKGGEIKIWIFKLGRKVDRSKLHSVTLELTKGTINKAARMKIGKSDDLTNFINSALKDFQSLDTLKLVEPIKGLNKRKITIEIGLTITKSNNGGITSYEIGIFSLTAEGSKNSEQGHKLKLVFTKE
jgi:hypothetical protein